jgi:hypothetical protein
MEVKGGGWKASSDQIASAVSQRPNEMLRRSGFQAWAADLPSRSFKMPEQTDSVTLGLPAGTVPKSPVRQVAAGRPSTSEQSKNWFDTWSAYAVDCVALSGVTKETLREASSMAISAFGNGYSRCHHPLFWAQRAVAGGENS